MKRTSRLSKIRNPLSLALLVLSLVLNACTSMDRSPASGYYAREVEPSFSRERRIDEYETSLRELGITSSKALDDEEAEKIGLRTTLRKAERLIEGKSERELYYRNKPYMRNDQERLEFLAIPNQEARQRWLNAKGISSSATSYEPQVQALIDINDITLGMTRQAVRDSWGEPETVEVSGNPLYGNERWHYNEQVSSTEGYKSEHRLVYFDSGRVVGWETRQ